MTDIDDITNQIDNLNEEKKEKEEVKTKPLLVVSSTLPKEPTKEERKEQIQDFNKKLSENPEAKVYNVRLISNKSFKWMIAIIIILSLLFMGVLVWKNIIFHDLTERNFNPIVNNNLYPPNETTNVTTNVNAPTTNNNEYKNYFNVTIVNNVTVYNVTGV